MKSKSGMVNLLDIEFFSDFLLEKHVAHRFINVDRIINSKTVDNHIEAMASAVLFSRKCVRNSYCTAGSQG